jgi:uncharacterized YccA/Bax inhibitor family protein
MRTTNPALNTKVFANVGQVASGEAVMTVQGTVNKTAILLLVSVATASWIWGQAQPGVISPFVWVGALGGLAVGFITFFNKAASPITAPIYAGLEGLALGGISSYSEAMFPGIVIQAVALTFGTLGCLLLAYTSRMIKVTNNFRMGVVSATGAIFVFYMLGFVLSFFGIRIPYIHESGLMGIGFSLFVVTIAALNLVLDFDFIERGSHAETPKFMEWFAAFGLMVTLVWLYLEILRLLVKLRSRR